MDVKFRNAAPPPPSSSLSSSSLSSSSSSSSCCSQKHDVFLSFRGEDTRFKFTSHLEKKLRSMKIETYIDNRLEKGDNISDALIEAIRGSKISVIIFSVNYATSSWCLDEVLCILECMRERGQVVLPVFYEVDPTNVRKQSGSYGAAFVKLKTQCNDNKINQWRVALSQVAKLDGFHSKNYGTEAELTEAIVKDIMRKLNGMSTSGGFKDLIGIEKSVEEVENLLCINSSGVRIIGIWGMGGLGKTTLARVVYDRLSSHFEACCFLQSVREESEKPKDLEKLKKKLFAVLLDEKDLDYITRYHEDRLGRKKVLIVLDDVDQPEQLDDLAGDHSWFGEGSRVIITTRNYQVLRDRADEKYELMALNFDCSLELFNQSAFKRNYSPTNDDTHVSKRVVDYAKGIPFALKVLGAFLRSRRRENWGIELDRLKEVPNRIVQNALKISHDGLDEQEKKIFLDIVCFLRLGTRTCRHFVERMLGGDKSLKREIDSLIDKSLIFDEHNYLRMHDLVREMGLEIVRQECIKEPGKRSRLWVEEDCYGIFKYNTGTIAIEGISVDSRIVDVELSPIAFKEMHRLRFLQIVKTELQQKRHHLLKRHWENYTQEIDERDAQPSQQCLQYLPCALKYLEWESWPFKSMPKKISPRNLVELRMICSNLEQLWSGDQDLGNLKYVNLSGSDRLSDVSALSQAVKLESVDLSYCKRLHHVPSLRFRGSDKSFHKCDEHKCSTVRQLNCLRSDVKVISRLSGCKSLHEVPSLGFGDCVNSYHKCNDDNCSTLGKLDLSFCVNLKVISKISGCVKILNLSFCSIEEMPSASIEHLEELHLSFCQGINKNFSTSVFELKSLKCLSLEGCNISEISNGIRYLSLLEELTLSLNPICEIPGGIQQLRKLRKLVIQKCMNLKFLPELPPSLQLVDVSECIALRTISRLTDDIFQQQEPWTDYQVNRRIRFLFIGCTLDQGKLVKRFVLRVLRVAAAIVLNDVNVNQELGFPDIGICISRHGIPKWFLFQSEGFKICVKLLPQWHNPNFLGFAVAVVTHVAATLSYLDFFGYLDFTCYLSFKMSNDEIRRFEWNLGENFTVGRGRNMLMMWYKYENYHDCRDAVEVSLHFCCHALGKLEGTGLGLRLLYLQDYEDVFGASVECYNNKIVFLP